MPSIRLVQVLIPVGTRADILSALESEGVDYVVFEEVGRGDFEAMIQFPVPPSGVEPILEDLFAAGIREEAYTIILPIQTVVSQRLSKLVERFPGLRISREELSARAEDLAPANSTFFAFLILSVVIATTGLLLDSAATIIGAMVIAPLMGSRDLGECRHGSRRSGHGCSRCDPPNCRTHRGHPDRGDLGLAAPTDGPHPPWTRRPGNLSGRRAQRARVRSPHRFHGSRQ